MKIAAAVNSIVIAASFISVVDSAATVCKLDTDQWKSCPKEKSTNIYTPYWDSTGVYCADETTEDCPSSEEAPDSACVMTTPKGTGKDGVCGTDFFGNKQDGISVSNMDDETDENVYMICHALSTDEENEDFYDYTKYPACDDGNPHPAYASICGVETSKIEPCKYTAEDMGMKSASSSLTPSFVVIPVTIFSLVVVTDVVAMMM